MTIERPALLILIRHAESERNKAKKGSVYFPDAETRKSIQGIPDHEIRITPEGVNHAERTGGYLRGRFGRPDYIYHSGYARTQETAKRLHQAFPDEERNQIKLRMNMFIRERDPGFAYDMTTHEAESAFPYLQEYWKTFGGFMARPPGGQSIADVCGQVYIFLNMLFRDRAGKKIWIVTHGGTIRAFRFLLEHWEYQQAVKWPEGQSPKNCGLTVYEYDKRTVALLYMSMTRAKAGSSYASTTQFVLDQ
ncbi:histidine phosphatase family protein [Candidatus Parcubacteria bacterium]|nr:histidine phosphatase family protein [Candidatus Parcubacteria bacterium]